MSCHLPQRTVASSSSSCEFERSGVRKYHQFFCGVHFSLRAVPLPHTQFLKSRVADHEGLVGLVELQRVVTHLLAAEHRQRLEDQLAHVDVVQPVVEVEAVVVAPRPAGELRPLVYELAQVGDVGRTRAAAVASFAALSAWRR